MLWLQSNEAERQVQIHCIHWKKLESYCSLGKGSGQALRREPEQGLEASTLNDVAQAKAEDPELSLNGAPGAQAGAVHGGPECDWSWPLRPVNKGLRVPDAWSDSLSSDHSY